MNPAKHEFLKVVFSRMPLPCMLHCTFTSGVGRLKARAMQRKSVDKIRAYLMTASLTSAGLDAIYLFAYVCLGIPEKTLVGAKATIGNLAIVIGVLMLTRFAARLAFEMALQRHAVVGDSASGPVRVDASCPWRLLVLLHLRFTGVSSIAVP
jgi:hypothetical protein